jgi:hypothetical protein
VLLEPRGHGGWVRGFECRDLALAQQPQRQGGRAFGREQWIDERATMLA